MLDPLRPAGISSQAATPMKEPDAAAASRNTRSQYGPGTYVSCSRCGRLLKIEWATRSIVCSCGARIKTVPPRK